MSRFVLPDENMGWDARLSFRSLPLADCVLALWLIANGHERSARGGKRLAALKDQLTVSQARAVTEQFRAPFVPDLLIALIATLAESADPGALLTALGALSDDQIVAHLVYAAGELAVDAPRGRGVWLSLAADPAWAQHYIQHYLSSVPSDPEQLLARIAQPAETRERLLSLLHDLLPTVILPLLPELRTSDTAANTRTRREFARDPERFAAAWAPFAIWSDETTHALFWPSTFLGNGRMVTQCDAEGTLFVAYGADEVTHVEQSDVPTNLGPVIAPPETYQDVYRLLADPARWALIQFLVDAPRYGQELAELLGLSIATVSHHLNGLKKLDLVTIRRDEHRLYYHLRTDRLRALLAGAEQHLLS